MELWELQARHAIADIVARYNANADSGRYDPVLELFAEDAVFESVEATGERTLYEGREGVRRVFTGIARNLKSDADAQRVPNYIRHVISTYQIDFADPTHARGYGYWSVYLANGLDRWGRYRDQYECRDGRWMFTRRAVLRDVMAREA